LILSFPQNSGPTPADFASPAAEQGEYTQFILNGLIDFFSACSEGETGGLFKAAFPSCVHAFAGSRLSGKNARNSDGPIDESGTTRA
jgi:hypothetical protein